MKCGSPKCERQHELRGDLKKKGQFKIKWSCKSDGLNKHFAKYQACKEVEYLAMSGIEG